MTLLRIRASLPAPPQTCQWALLADGQPTVLGEGALEQLPQTADVVHLILPAAQVLLLRARVPRSARRRAEGVLGFAVEEKTASDPEANQVSWLGVSGNDDVLAVVDRQALRRWHLALEAVGLRVDAVHCESLFLPHVPGDWTLAWAGGEGYLRSGEFEGAATDCGDRTVPPLMLHMVLEEAKARGEAPACLHLSVKPEAAAPDLKAWQQALGIPLQLAEPADWRSAAPTAGIPLAQPHAKWVAISGVASRLRAAAWIGGVALAIHAGALLTDWSLLAGEQRDLRRQMERQFRATFPEAVAVADPALQMRRKLAEARHGAGLADDGDFLPMIAILAPALKDLPLAGLRSMSYEGGRLTLELSPGHDQALRRIEPRLVQSGFKVESRASPPGAARSSLVLIVRAS